MAICALGGCEDLQHFLQESLGPHSLWQSLTHLFNCSKVVGFSTAMQLFALSSCFLKFHGKYIAGVRQSSAWLQSAGLSVLIAAVTA